MNSTDKNLSYNIVNCSVDKHLSSQHLDAYRRDGYIILRNIIHKKELASLQTESTILIDSAISNAPNAPAHIGADIIRDDTTYRLTPTGETWPHRINHIIAKSLAARSLLAHPQLLASVNAIINQDFIPTWDTLGIKKTGGGISIPWHRDANANKLSGEESDQLLFNCDCYLDRATEENCLWVIPGSHQWSQERISLELNKRREENFSTEAASPICLEAGDILLRNTLLFNGAPAAFGKNQRIIHFEFRPVSLIQKYQWFEQRFVDKKRAMLSRCVASRKRQAVTATDKPYPWPHQDDGEREFRFPQEDYGWTF